MHTYIIYLPGRNFKYKICKKREGKFFGKGGEKGGKRKGSGK
jgi:hypothetical protein